MPPAARITDVHACPAVPAPMSGPIVTGQMTVLIAKLPAARVTDSLVCAGPDKIVKGSSGVFIGGLPAARIGDNTAFGGVIALGWPTVIIGEKMGGGGSAAPVVPAGPAKPCLKAAAKAGVPFVRA